MMSRVYLDHAATSPLRPEVLEAMLPWLGEGFGNANALYREGKQARQALDDARASIAAIIGTSPTEIVFTSGGTESNNALIAGITQAIREKKGKEKGGNHVVCSAFEHHAVLEPIKALRRSGYEVGLVKPSRDGFIQPEALAGTLRPDTMLSSVMMAQNEIGTIQPVAELARVAHANGTLMHSDAVQALGKIPLNVAELGLDAASFSAHKIGGPKGVGAFYLKSRTPFIATQLGGGQEGNRRSGTQNVAGAVGFARALELAEKEREWEAYRLSELRDRLARELLALDSRISLTVGQKNIASAGTSASHNPVILSETKDRSEDMDKASSHSLRMTGEQEGFFRRDSSSATTNSLTTLPTHLPGLLSILVAGYESETLILKLDDAGFAVSGGSACSTGSLEPSHVLISLGLTRNQAYGALRISLGWENTAEDIDRFLSAFARILKGNSRL